MEIVKELNLTKGRVSEIIKIKKINERDIYKYGSVPLGIPFLITEIIYTIILLNSYISTL